MLPSTTNIPIMSKPAWSLRKVPRSHWMWFIFPQIEGLGYSAMARKFAISSSAEAQGYLDHPILGPRLRRCTELVNLVDDRSIDEIFGYPDNPKLHASMTLFSRVARRSRAS
jgi:uncharacterized protein (DUF1810 family)